jgi:hypothetical protein
LSGNLLAAGTIRWRRAINGCADEIIVLRIGKKYYIDTTSLHATMLDPLSCFGIACNVMQVISLSIEITSIVKRIKKEGTADTDLREHAGNLSKISNELENYLKGCDLKQLLKNQVELQEITVRCLETSRGIQALIDNIDSTRGGRVVKALKMRSKKSTFERLEKAMQKYQDTMQTHILVHLW